MGFYGSETTLLIMLSRTHKTHIHRHPRLITALLYDQCVISHPIGHMHCRIDEKSYKICQFSIWSHPSQHIWLLVLLLGILET